MLTHTEKKILPYPADFLFALISDIEKYPEFLPWCSGAKIHERAGNELTASLDIHFAGMTETYTSKVILKPDEDHPTISVKAISGPFSHLENHWAFTSTAFGTIVDFDISFEFSSKMLERLIGIMFDRAAHKMVTSFEERALELYQA